MWSIIKYGAYRVMKSNSVCYNLSHAIYIMPANYRVIYGCWTSNLKSNLITLHNMRWNSIFHLMKIFLVLTMFIELNF